MSNCGIFDIPYINVALSLVYWDLKSWPKVRQRLKPEVFSRPEIDDVYSIFNGLHSANSLTQDSVMVELSKIAYKSSQHKLLVDDICTGPISCNLDHYIGRARESAYDRIEAELKEQRKRAVMSEQDDLEREIALRIANLRSERDNTQAGSEGSTIGDVFLDVIEGLQDDSKISYISTGYRKLDHAIGGWAPGNLVIMAARPGLGKTTCAINFIHKAMHAGKNVAFFSLEMGEDEINRRTIAMEAGVENRRLKLGQHALRQDELDKLWRSGERVNQENPLGRRYLQCGAKTIKKITETTDLWRAEAKGGIDLLVIDYLTLIKPEGNAQNREREVAQMSTALKHYAMEARIPVICLAQPSRRIEMRDNKRPMNSDLRDSGQIEQDADIIMWVDRQVDDQQKIAAATAFAVTKNRHGETGVVDGFYFDAPTQNLREV